MKSVSGYAIVAGLVSTFTFHCHPTLQAEAQAQDRGLFVFQSPEMADGDPSQSGGNSLTWRIVSADARFSGWVVMRDGSEIARIPIDSASFHRDPDGRPDSIYQILVSPDPEGEPMTISKPVRTEPDPWMDIALKNPDPGKSSFYSPSEASTADLDNDGELDLILKWVAREADNSRDGPTSPTLLQGIKMDGTVLWNINLGRNIRSGAHYTPFIACDLDRDGSVEILVRSSEATSDNKGDFIGNPEADFRDSRGRVLTAPEYIAVFDGRNGSLRYKTTYLPERGEVTDWGDDYGNRSERHLMCVARTRPDSTSLITARGYYRGRRGMGPGKTVIVAWQWNGSSLSPDWIFDTSKMNQNDAQKWIGQGTHSLASGDIDGDGFDEILYGAMAIDHDGSPIYSTGYGHGDAHHLSDFDPENPGLEFFMPHEEAAPGVIPGISFRDAATGRILWELPVTRPRDVARAAIGDLVPESPGAESWGLDRNLYSARGQIIGPAPGTAANFLIWWDGDLQREILNSNWISKYDSDSPRALKRLLTADGFRSTNGSKSTPILSADLIGDWREECVFLSNDRLSLRIFISPVPTEYGIPTLMEDTLYRHSIASQNVGYNQPPHTGTTLRDMLTVWNKLLAK